ncbi:hypothetical protein BCR44DRAFT_257637 [Catenaria anguillulae PL171]|uniref:Uncharacterized protein n=1 Tax=Catenaria anguillulae PL171 TaxID=765915 RepID=A0A1Y2HUI7_9FUNG|nr:hypothetical protein BCR44DRAFT_257637 [Catenaria anguillulae PL171]
MYNLLVTQYPACLPTTYSVVLGETPTAKHPTGLASSPPLDVSTLGRFYPQFPPTLPPNSIGNLAHGLATATEIAPFLPS